MIVRSLIVASVFALVIPAAAQTKDDLRILNVDGRAEMQVDPDQAIIRFGSTSQSGDADDAIEELAEITTAANQVVIDAGVPAENVQTTGLRVSPVYRDRKIVAYNATNETTVLIEELQIIPQLLGALGEAGINEISGIQFEVKDADTLRDQVLLSAIDDAAQRAQLVATQMGVGLGAPVTVNTNTGGGNFAVQRAGNLSFEAAFDDGGPQVPISSGQVTIEANVSVTYELEVEE